MNSPSEPPETSTPIYEDISSPVSPLLPEFELEVKDYIIEFLEDRVKKLVESNVLQKLTIERLEEEKRAWCREKVERESQLSENILTISSLQKQREDLQNIIHEKNFKLHTKDDLIQDSLKMVNHYYGGLIHDNMPKPKIVHFVPILK